MRRLFILALALLPSCSLALIDGPHNRCTTDRDCTTGTCDRTTLMCVSTPPAPLMLGLEIAVPATGASVGAVYPQAPFAVYGPDYDHPLSAPRPITVAGTVRQPGRDGAIQADVVFTPDETIPGRPGTVVRVSTTAMPTTVDPVAVADYVAQLTGVTHYSVRIEPTGADRALLPPLVPVSVDSTGRDLVNYTTADSSAVEADFTYPATLDTLQGDLVTPTDTHPEGVPVSGLTVQAVDPVTGDVVSSSPVSAPDTDPRPGSFTLTFAPGVTRWLLRVSAPAGSGVTGMPVPTFTVDPTRIYPSGSRARILVPSPTAIRYSGTVERADGGGAVAGATVLVSSIGEIVDSATSAPGTYRAPPTTTDETGAFSVWLVPGKYQLVVVPGAGMDDLAVTLVDDIDLSGATAPVMGRAFEVQTRARFGGSVTTADGHGMSGTTVQATAVGPDGCLAGSYARSPAASTDPSGHFSTHLDCAVFDVVAQPPSGTGYAWTAHTNVTIGASGVVTDDFTLEAPVPLSGTLSDATGAPIAGAEIRAFGIVSALDGAQRSVAIGRVTTDAAGHYSLLLPPSL